MNVNWDLGFSHNSPEFLLVDKPEDMEEFRSEKTVKGGGKSVEEIERLTVDENLSDMEKACLFVSSAQEIQRVFVVEHLPELLKRNQTEALHRIVPKICDSLSSATPVLHAAASKAFGETARDALVPTHIFTAVFLPPLLTCVDSKDSITNQVWLEALLLAIPLLTRDVIKKSVLSIAIAKGQLSQSVASRRASCRIIGVMATKFEPFWLKRELLPLATTLCQDVDQDVRRCMCRQLCPVARALGLELSRTSILPELLELSNDEESSVRVAAMEIITELLSFFDPSTLSTTVAPLLRGCCEQALKTGDLSLPAVARLLGEQYHRLNSIVGKEQQSWFLQFYRRLSQYSRADTGKTPSSLSLTSGPREHSSESIEADCRQLCAYNFPAMLLVASPSSFEKELSTILKSFVADDRPAVRRTIACGFHEVVSILGEGCLKVMALYSSLLRDISPDVLSGLVEHLPDVLSDMADASHLAPETRQPSLLDVVAPLLAADTVASSCRRWRLHEQLLGAWSTLPRVLTSEQIYTKFVPTLLRHIKGGNVLPVKLSAGHTLCILIRHNRRQEQRSELCSWIVRECGQSPNSKQRLLFIELCQFFLDTFSRNFFKEIFFEVVLELAQDPIVNVRLRLCRLLPALKATLKLPGDRQLLQQLEITVRKLISQERDPDAMQAVSVAVTELDRIEVAMETLTRRTFFEADLTDQYREKEELDLLQAEEKEKREKEREGGGKPPTGKKGKAAGKAHQSPSDSRKGSVPTISHQSSCDRKGSVPTISTSTTNSPSIVHRSVATVKAKTPTALRRAVSSPTPPAKSKTPNPTRRSLSPAHSTQEVTDGADTAARRGQWSPANSPGVAKHALVSTQMSLADKRSPGSSPGSSHAGLEKPASPATLSSKPPATKNPDTTCQKNLASSKKKGYGSVYTHASTKSKRT